MGEQGVRVVKLQPRRQMWQCLAEAVTAMNLVTGLTETLVFLIIFSPPL
jgi:hypothetical protein